MKNTLVTVEIKHLLGIRPSPCSNEDERAGEMNKEKKREIPTGLLFFEPCHLDVSLIHPGNENLGIGNKLGCKLGLLACLTAAIFTWNRWNRCPFCNVSLFDRVPPRFRLLRCARTCIRLPRPGNTHGWSDPF